MSLCPDTPRRQWADAGEATQVLKRSASRRRVTTSHVERSSVGCNKLESPETLGVIDGPGALTSPDFDWCLRAWESRRRRPR